MLQNILMIALALLIIGAAFWIGFFLGMSNAFNMVEDIENSERLYCFECETDTEVKEKNANYYCGECGLYHGTKI